MNYTDSNKYRKVNTILNAQVKDINKGFIKKKKKTDFK